MLLLTTTRAQYVWTGEFVQQVVSVCPVGKAYVLGGKKYLASRLQLEINRSIRGEHVGGDWEIPCQLVSALELP